jgi:hypothetical protein
MEMAMWVLKLSKMIWEHPVTFEASRARNVAESNDMASF